MLQELLKTKLRIAREKKGFKQEDIALKLGIHINTYSRYERGERKISAELIEQIAELTDIPIAWFFTPEEDSDTPNAPFVTNTIPIVPDLQQKILTKIDYICSYCEKLEQSVTHEELLGKIEKLLKKTTVSQILEEKNGLNSNSGFFNNHHNNLIPFPGSPAPLIHPRTLPLMEQAIGAGEKLAEDIKPIGNITVSCQGKPDVAIRVEGLSMEPDILDGSLILVRHTQIFGSWGWNNWDIVVVWLKESDEWTVKQIQVSPDRTKARLIGTKGYLKRYEMKDIEVQGVVEDVIKDPAEVETILKGIKLYGDAYRNTDTDTTFDNPADDEISPEEN